MGFRFRKSIKLFPGVRVNLSKSGVSATIGKPGATINVSERGTSGTIGIPGTGISYSEKLSDSGPKLDSSRVESGPSESENSESGGMSFGALLGWGLVALVVGMVIFR